MRDNKKTEAFLALILFNTRLKKMKAFKEHLSKQSQNKRHLFKKKYIFEAKLFLF